jgi:hypothetical protein
LAIGDDPSRGTPKGHTQLSDPFLWHDFYNCYINALPYSQDVLGHLRIVGKIAGQYAKRRFGPSRPLPSAPAEVRDAAYDGWCELVHALIAAGNEGLLAAVRTFDPARGKFSTHANSWIRKYIRPEAESLASAVYRPRRKTTWFDSSLTVTGGNPDDDEIELFGTEGPTRQYLQRKVGLTTFPWIDVGTYERPRLKMPRGVWNEPAQRVEPHERLSLALIEPSFSNPPQRTSDLPEWLDRLPKRTAKKLREERRKARREGSHRHLPRFPISTRRANTIAAGQIGRRNGSGAASGRRAPWRCRNRSQFATSAGCLLVSLSRLESSAGATVGRMLV